MNWKTPSDGSLKNSLIYLKIPYPNKKAALT
jgi:hypothetical protein